MTRQTVVKKLCICAICMALCCVLPVALHSVGLGQVLSPMHLPVLLCGLLCGGFFGGFCGVAGPVLSSLISGMPNAAALVSMIPELVVYGVVSGLLMRWIRTGKLYADLYIALPVAMVLGRIVGGLAKILFLTGGESYSLSLWVSGYFVGTFPGIVVQLVLLPTLVVLLMKAKVIPARYPKKV